MSAAEPARKFTRRIVLLVCACVAICSAASAAEKVDPDKVRVSISPPAIKVMCKAPASFSFTIHNDSRRDLVVALGGDNRNRLGRPNSFSVRVTGAGGKVVPQPEVGPEFGGISWMQKIPSKGKYDVGLYMPHWADIQSAGTYAITVKRILRVQYAPAGGLTDDSLTAIDVEAKGTLEVAPYAAGPMGKLIDKLGAEFLTSHSGSAMRDLANIQDSCVIPYFVKGIESGRYSIQFGSLRALGNYDDAAAFAALKRGMRLSADDIENASTRKVAVQLAVNLRHACAGALSQSPHPGAIAFLLTQRSDPAEAVRITILHVLGDMPPAKALPVLREMATDKSERVRNEAKRYIALLTAKK